MTEAFRDSMESLNVVVVVLIFAARGLAFVVLYSLTNINISERIRELSTIKVGFYDNEDHVYLSRKFSHHDGILQVSLGDTFMLSWIPDG